MPEDRIPEQESPRISLRTRRRPPCVTCSDNPDSLCALCAEIGLGPISREQHQAINHDFEPCPDCSPLPFREKATQRVAEYLEKLDWETNFLHEHEVLSSRAGRRRNIAENIVTRVINALLPLLEAEVEHQAEVLSDLVCIRHPDHRGGRCMGTAHEVIDAYLNILREEEDMR